MWMEKVGESNARLSPDLPCLSNLAPLSRDGILSFVALLVYLKPRKRIMERNDGTTHKWGLKRDGDDGLIKL